MNETDVAVKSVYTGEVKTVAKDQAAILIGTGQAVETLSEDKEQALVQGRAWTAKALAEWRSRQPPGQAFQVIEGMEYVQPYIDWCTLEQLPAYPAAEGNVVRYLLERTRDDMPEHKVRRAAAFICEVHQVTGHPPRNLAFVVANGYTRALNFAQAKLREMTANVAEVREKAPAKALELFPDGNVPLRWVDMK